MDKAKLAALLGRPLSPIEATNFDLYLKISYEKLQELLCIELKQDTGQRTYVTRIGYRDAYIDPFTEINSVTVDGVLVLAENYVVKQNDKFNGDWYNILEFNEKQWGKKIVVDAEWGFDCLPVDLQQLAAAVFDNISKQNTYDKNLKSKKIEDFTVTYSDSSSSSETLWATLVDDNAAVIDKYSQCNVTEVRHGRVYDICY